MFDILKLIFDICLFKKGPQDIPHSVFLLKILIAAYAAVRGLMLTIGLSWFQALLQIAIEIAFVSGFSWIMLYLDRKPERFCQLASAFFGAIALIGFVALPAIATMAIGRGGWPVFLLTLALTGWYCAVSAHIIYHALEQRLGLSIGVGVLFLLGSYQVLILLFPEISGVD